MLPGDPVGEHEARPDSPPPTVRAKICGLTRGEDVRHAAEQGADFLGFVLSAGFGRSVPPETAGRLLRGVTTPRVAVVVDEPADAVARAATLIDASVIQLHGSESPSEIETLRRLGPWQIWMGVRARSSRDVLQACETYGSLVDGMLVDGWKEGVVGGGGVRVAANPEEVRAAVRATFGPGGAHPRFVLAGGLTPENVAEAVARFGPDVVDVSSGVEAAPGRKDPRKVEAFIRRARAASAPEPSDFID